MLQFILFYKELAQFLLFFLFAGLFIYGMTLLRSGLFHLTEDSLKKRLIALTSSPWKGFIAGLLMTAILQSSAAVMIVTIGLISVRLLSFPQSIGIILGTNVGKNITFELLTLDIHSLAIPLALLGAILLFSKRKNTYHSGLILLGLAAIFSSMWGFESLLVLLKDLEIMKQLLLVIEEHHAYAMIAGIITAAMLQSSHAATGMIIGALSAGVFTLETGLSMMLGTIFAACVHVLFIAYTSSGKEGQLAAFAFTWVNLLSVAVFYPLIEPLAAIAQQLSALPDVQFAHASFMMNLITSIIFLLFAKQFQSLILKFHGSKKIPGS